MTSRTSDLYEAALDRALQDRFSLMFGALVTGLIAGEPSAISHFGAGMALLQEAHRVAEELIAKAEGDKGIPGK